MGTFLSYRDSQFPTMGDNHDCESHESDSEASRLGLKLSSLASLPLAPISMLCESTRTSLFLHVPVLLLIVVLDLVRL